MKKLTVLSMWLVTLTALAAKGQGIGDNEYKTAMERALIALDSAKTASDLTISRNGFERISQKYPKQWQPVYYVAYCDIEMTFRGQKPEDNQPVLDDAKKHLEQLDSYQDADKSEVNTLWGYYYMATITQNPAANGQKYFGRVYTAFDKAIEQNAENPRPVILRLFFDSFMPEFIRPERDRIEEIEKAETLFAEETKGIEKPYWGKYFLYRIINQNK